MSGEDEQQEQTIAEDLVVTKYKMGGDIANRVLRSLVEASSSGVSVLSLCEKGDAMIMEETGKIFKKEKEMKKGIAFPTSISVNNCVCHFSPLKSDQDYILKEGDLVKIDLGVHVDGFIANVAHTFVIGVAQGTHVTGRKADVIKAAHLCAEAALRLVKPGNQGPLRHESEVEEEADAQAEAQEEKDEAEVQVNGACAPRGRKLRHAGARGFAGPRAVCCPRGSRTDLDHHRHRRLAPTP